MENKELAKLSGRKSRLYDKCQQLKAFKVGRIIYKGNYRDVVEDFIYNNPLPADFSVWLQDNIETIN